jgi:hypothetical protein
MVDVLFIFIFVAFFALMVAFVRVCERVVGTDDPVEPDYVDAAESDPTTTTAEEVPA